MSSRRFFQAIEREMRRRREAGLFRARRVADAIDSVHVEFEGRRLTNFCSNDYLGLAHHPRMIEAVARAAQTHGFGSGAAPLISGYSPAHQSAEEAIAAWKGCEAAVLFPSGYQANVAAIQTAAAIAALDGEPALLIDRLAHASLLDGCQATRASFRRFAHNDMAALRGRLGDEASTLCPVIVTESIFSMDGDAAPLHALARIKDERDCLLLLDEAHASGVYGTHGAGLAAELGLSDSVDLSIVTFSKALGGVGAAICGSKTLCDAVVNFGRAYLFSTSIPACVAVAAETAVGILRDEPHRQQRVRALARRLRTEVTAMGFSVPTGDSPIIPIMAGDEQAALKAAEMMAEAGLLVLAVRPPTVPKGKCRLRITLSAMHSESDVDKLLEGLKKLTRHRADWHDAHNDESQSEAEDDQATGG